jgi:hypothetical protein
MSETLGGLVRDIRDQVGGLNSGTGIPAHDYISNTYTDGNLTSVAYKSGGAGGVVVATLTLTYDGSGNLLTVARS